MTGGQNLDYLCKHHWQYFHCKDNDFDCNDNLGADPRLDEESAIVFKIYDSCQHKECLDESKIGLARAAESVRIGDEHIARGDVIHPPQESTWIDIHELRIKKITIGRKKRNKFRRGFWDIDIHYVFECRITFHNADKHMIGSVKANHNFNKKVTLFGSTSVDYIISTDLTRTELGKNYMFNADPFVLVEAKAEILETGLRLQNPMNHDREDHARKSDGVIAVIGLFTVITLFRIVDLSIKSGGIGILEEFE